jgi:hypothetical protein
MVPAELIDTTYRALLPDRIEELAPGEAGELQRISGQAATCRPSGSGPRPRVGMPAWLSWGDYS